MLARSLNFFVLGTTAFTAVQAQQYAGDEGAVQACQGFPAGVMKCLTDVSFVLCTGAGNEREQFVAAGTYCKQGTPGVMKDAILQGAATATQVFKQAPPMSTFTTVAQPPASDTASSAAASSSTPDTSDTAPAPSQPASSVAESSEPAGSSASTATDPAGTPAGSSVAESSAATPSASSSTATSPSDSSAPTALATSSAATPPAESSAASGSPTSAAVGSSSNNAYDNLTSAIKGKLTNTIVPTTTSSA